MKPELNKTLIRPGFSWRHFMDEAPLSKATLHYHNEYELILLVNYQGQVRVNHIDVEVASCSLLLVPPQVPHFLGNLTKNTGNSERHSLWIDKNWISNMMTHCSEMHKLSKLLSNPMNGVSFSHEAAISAYKVLNKLDYGSSSLGNLNNIAKINKKPTQNILVASLYLLI